MLGRKILGPHQRQAQEADSVSVRVSCWPMQVQTEVMGDIHHYAWRARLRNQTVYLHKRDGERFGDWASQQCSVGTAFLPYLTSSKRKLRNIFIQLCFPVTMSRTGASGF